MRKLKYLFIVLIGLISVAGVILLLLIPPALKVPARKDIVIANVHVVNPGFPILMNQTVVIKDGIIHDVRPAEKSDKTTPGIDVPAESWIFPGLIDMHVHFPPNTAIGNQKLFALLFLAHGVTTVRDMGHLDDGSLYDTRREIRNGGMPGPEIYTPGKVLDGSPPFFGIARVVKNDADAETAVLENLAKGADFIKPYSNLRPAQLSAIRSLAQKKGVRLMGHLPHRVDISGSGISDISHSEEVFPLPEDLNPSDLLQGTTVRMDVWEKAKESDFQKIVDISKAENIAHVPTIMAYRRVHFKENHRTEMQKKEYQYLPRYWRDIVWNLDAGVRKAEKTVPYTRWENYLQLKIKLVRMLIKAGVPVYAGTDSPNPLVLPGKSLHGEIRELIKAGMSASEALAAATVKPGAYMSKNLGKIEKNAPADILVLSKNPLTNLDALEAPSAVIARGRFYSRSYLASCLAEYQNHFNGFAYELLTHKLAEFVTKQYD